MLIQNAWGKQTKQQKAYRFRCGIHWLAWNNAQREKEIERANQREAKKSISHRIAQSFWIYLNVKIHRLFLKQPNSLNEEQTKDEEKKKTEWKNSQKNLIRWKIGVRRIARHPFKMMMKKKKKTERQKVYMYLQQNGNCGWWWRFGTSVCCTLIRGWCGSIVTYTKRMCCFD